MSLDFSLVREMRQNLTQLLEYLVDKEIQDTPWKAHVEKQLFDIGQEILLLLDELEKYTEFKISDSFQPYDFFHYLLLHFETLEAKIGAIPPLVLQELRDWFDLFNQFEAKLSTFLEPLRSQTCWAVALGARHVCVSQRVLVGNIFEKPQKSQENRRTYKGYG